MKTILKTDVYYDNVANFYDDLYLDDISIYENEAIRKMLVEFIKDLDRPKILDLGCGTGLGYELLSKSIPHGFFYSGIDIAPQMIYKAKRQYGEDQYINFYIEDMTDLSMFDDNSFSVVMSLFGSFSHVIDYERGLSEIYRILKPGGKLFLMTYSKYSISSIISTSIRLNCSMAFKRPYNIRNSKEQMACDALFYSPSILNNALSAIGFRNVKYRGLNYFMEIDMLKKLLLKFPLLIKGWADIENKVLSGFPKFAHSLITIGEKQNDI